MIQEFEVFLLIVLLLSLKLNYPFQAINNPYCYQLLIYF